MNCIIYTRSLNTITGQQSKERQLESCRKYAIANNYNVIAEYADLGTTSDSRIEYDRMLSDVFEKQIQIILIYSGDRITRYRNKMISLRLYLENYGIKIICVGDEGCSKAA